MELAGYVPAIFMSRMSQEILVLFQGPTKSDRTSVRHTATCGGIFSQRIPEILGAEFHATDCRLRTRNHDHGGIQPLIFPSAVDSELAGLAKSYS